MTILVTGGAGFIGANFVLDWLELSDERVVNLDKLTYAGNLATLASLDGDCRHVFVRGDIGDMDAVGQLLAEHQPRALINFAAESHVDHSILGPEAFVQTNVVGTFRLLEAVRAHWSTLKTLERDAFRLLHVSTDEVFGSLLQGDAPFSESSRHEPNSPYSASKAASDHLVRAWHQTYGLPVLTTHCSNNLGPYQYPEKLIPLVIMKALNDEQLPIYGDGLQERDWLHVKDHCNALRRVLEGGRVGHTYNIGSGYATSNIELVSGICALLDELRPRTDGKSYSSQICHVEDRPGHDRRYALDTGKLEHELDWRPSETLHSAVRKTVQWYLSNQDWVSRVQANMTRTQAPQPASGHQA